jgi:hypothetical protein
LLPVGERRGEIDGFLLQDAEREGADCEVGADAGPVGPVRVSVASAMMEACEDIEEKSLHGGCNTCGAIIDTSYDGIQK